MQYLQEYRQYPFQAVHDEPRLHLLLSDSAAAGANCGYGYHGTKMKALSIAIVPQVQHYAKLLASKYDLQIINGVLVLRLLCTEMAMIEWDGIVTTTRMNP